MKICDICKINEATITLQQYINGQVKVINICQECAQKQQNDIKMLAGDINIEEILENIKKITEKLNLQDVVANNIKSVKKKQDNYSNMISCPKCHWNIAKMEQNHGFLGCDECYKTFKDIVNESIENIHRCKIHTGKRPINISGDDSDLAISEKINQLESDLQNAIQEEKYEQAAIIRDEINILKKSRGTAVDE